MYLQRLAFSSQKHQIILYGDKVFKAIENHRICTFAI